MTKNLKNQIEDDEDVVDVDTDVDTELEDEFEYDEDGNIIIPDVIDENTEEDEEIDVDLKQDEPEADADPDENEGSEVDTEAEEVVEPVKDDKDKKIEELEQKLAVFQKQGKDTLVKLGVDTEDVLEGLEKLAADVDDISIDEYRKSKADKERTEAAQKLLQKTEFDKKAATDLAELQQFYPETKNLNSIFDIENIQEFGRLRDLGLTAKQAYAAANTDGVKTHIAEAVKQQSLNDTKKHLQSAVPKGSKDESVTMTKKELSEWRDMFPKLSDKQIAALYKNSKNK